MCVRDRDREIGVDRDINRWRDREKDIERDRKREERNTPLISRLPHHYLLLSAITPQYFAKQHSIPSLLTIRRSKARSYNTYNR